MAARGRSAPGTTPSADNGRGMEDLARTASRIRTDEGMRTSCPQSVNDKVVRLDGTVHFLGGRTSG